MAPCVKGWAHPRSRGENLTYLKSPPLVSGSSPLTRGKQELPRLQAPQPGLIPAHAGKTLPQVPSQVGEGAHPRSRGENPRAGTSRRVGLGSSPLTRGKPGSWHSRRKRIGLIPAHAGKTLSSLPGSAARRAHPRSRGENTFTYRQGRDVPGSSPLTRGKHRGTRHLTMWIGLIPAHAGKTKRAGSRGTRPRAHPRSRGENFISIPHYVLRVGSSPLTRGKPVTKQLIF